MQSKTRSVQPHRARLARRAVSLLAVMSLVLALPLAPQGDAQTNSSLPSSSQQKQAADNLLAQLENIDGAVDPSSLSFDPALGPAPWVSFVPGRDQSTVDAWNILASRLADQKESTMGPAAARLALPGEQLVIQDIEGIDQSGLNDTASTGQLVSGFGTGPGEAGFARVTGVLSSPPPPPPPPPTPDCPSIEEDGAIPLANPTELSFGPEFVLCGGVIGDGTYGETSGDVDFYELNFVAAGSVITVDAGSFDPAAIFDLTTAVYDEAGNLLGSLNDSDSSPDSVLNVVAPADGFYYAAIAGVDVLPADPFDPASGTGITYVGDYLVILGTSQPPPEPCFSQEPDSSIPEANVLPFGPGQVEPCFGLIGDGVFGDSTGDFDFFQLQVDGPSAIIVDITPGGIAASTPTTIALYDAAGTLLASLDDDGIAPGVFLEYQTDVAGTYFALVSSQGVLPSDPFDASSGTVAGPDVNYQAFILSFPLLGPPPPPPPVEPTPTPPPGEPPTPVDPTPTPPPVDPPVPPVDPTPTPPPVDPPVPPVDPPPPTPTATPEIPQIPDEEPEIPRPLAEGAWAAEMIEARAMVQAATQERSAAIAAAAPMQFAQMDIPCGSIEDDGAIGLENPAALEPGQSVVCPGEIGDGPFGTTSGDFDFYSVFVNAGEALVADIDAAEFGGLDSFLEIYDASGNLLASNDDFDGLDSRIEFPVQADGLYFVAVSGLGSDQQDPFDSGSGSGATSTGPYLLTLGSIDAPAPPDVDVYLVDLEVGDVIGMGFLLNGTITIVTPFGQVGMGSAGSASIIYPQASPLRHLGNVGADYVAETAGRHVIYLENGSGPYEGELRVKRSGFTDTPGDDVQKIFLDFDGGSFNDAIFNPFIPDNAGTVRTLSPLADWLPRWGLDASDEDAVIDAVIAEFAENILHDLQEKGGNGNRDATGNGGEMDIEILNSRDHGDPWGEPNVSRIIIGGSIAEAGIPTVGVAQSIDPGNLVGEESAIVLLDLLSDPPGLGSPTLNQYGIAEGFTKVGLVGQGVGIIAAHEAGHFIGNWHTASFNGVPGVMDEGGDLTTTVGIGPDLIFGSADDFDTDFGTDEYSFFEGFLGIENTTVRSAQGLSTGQTNVPVDPGGDIPDDGVYFLRNVGNGRVLDADANGDVETSSTPRSDDRWRLISIDDGLHNLQNVDFGTYLDADANGTVDQSTTARSDDRWELQLAGDNSFFLFNPDRGRYLSATGSQARLSFNQSDAERWVFDATDDPGQNTNPFLNQQVALQSVTTGRWMDGDRNGNVDQSTTQRADDVWTVTDAGGGYVYLRNAVTRGYLDADAGDNNVETSRRPSNDDRWEMIVQRDGYAFRNAQYGGYLSATGSDGGYNVITEPELTPAGQWEVVVLSSPA